MITFFLMHGNDDATGLREFPALVGLLPCCRAIHWHQQTPHEITLIDYHHGNETSFVLQHAGAFGRALCESSVLVIWNGQAPELRVKVVEAARAAGIPVAHVELTPWADYLQIDTAGVNGCSTAASAPASSYADIMPAPDIDDTVWRTPVARGVDEPLPALPDETIFLPLQVMTDTQLQRHCADYSGLEAVFDAVVGALPDGMTLLVKEHPAGYAEDARAYPRLRAKYPAVRWCRSTPIPVIFSAVRGVVTVNSSVGLQAMQAGLPVLALGHDVWTRPGLVSRPEPTLAAGIRAMLQEAPDQEMRRRFLTWLRDRVYVPREPASMIRRLHEIAAGIVAGE